MYNIVLKFRTTAELQTVITIDANNSIYSKANQRVHTGRIKTICQPEASCRLRAWCLNPIKLRSTLHTRCFPSAPICGTPSPSGQYIHNSSFIVASTSSQWRAEACRSLVDRHNKYTSSTIIIRIKISLGSNLATDVHAVKISMKNRSSERGFDNRVSTVVQLVNTLPSVLLTQTDRTGSSQAEPSIGP